MKLDQREIAVAWKCNLAFSWQPWPGLVPELGSSDPCEICDLFKMLRDKIRLQTGSGSALE